MSTKIVRRPLTLADAVELLRLECTYCAARMQSAELLYEPVFAHDWYPVNTPAAVARPTVPACVACAEELGGVQSRLFMAWGITVAVANRNAKGVTRKIIRGLRFDRRLDRVDPTDVHRFMRLLVRGLHRFELGEVLPVDAHIETIQLKRAADFTQLTPLRGLVLEQRNLPPGLAYCYSRPTTGASLWGVSIWRRISLFAAATHA